MFRTKSVLNTAGKGRPCNSIQLISPGQPKYEVERLPLWKEAVLLVRYYPTPTLYTKKQRGPQPVLRGG